MGLRLASYLQDASIKQKKLGPISIEMASDNNQRANPIPRPYHRGNSAP